METKAKAISIKILSIVVLALPVLTSPVSAEEFLCDATQSSTKELPVLDKQCPIGKGLWGNQSPRAQESLFWIQCGLLVKPLALNKAETLYKNTTSDVWNKPEDKGYRCLVGPYKDYQQAKTDLVKVRKLKPYKEAFIREVAKGAPTVAMKKSASVKKAQSSKKVQPKSQVKPKSKVKPSAVAGTAIAAIPVMAESSSNHTTEINIRIESTLAGTKYAVPYIMFSDEQFYMEHGLPWNRLNYDAATQTCNALNMSLPTQEQWEKLLSANVMVKDKWPMHLPYWGKGRKGLFTSGKVSQLKGSSLLNIACVK